MTGSRDSWRLPFTNAEIFRAAALIYPPESVEAFRREFDRPLDEPTSVSLVGTQIYLALAALSDEHARRVVQCRPDLEAEVRRVLADPQDFIESERRSILESWERESK